MSPDRQHQADGADDGGHLGDDAPPGVTPTTTAHGLGGRVAVHVSFRRHGAQDSPAPPPP